MATGDQIIGSIDAALYRIQNREINNITPFTYRDGLTYYEVLHRIRQAVIESIDYILKYGKDQDKIVERLNHTVETFINDVETKHSEWNKTLDAKKDEVLRTIKEFRNQLVDARFEHTQDGDFVSAPMKDGGRTVVPSQQWANKLGDRFQQVTNDLNSQVRQVKTDIARDYYSITQANKKFVNNRTYDYPISLIIGSSNATDNSWVEWVKSRGEDPKKFSLGGGGFTSGESNNFVGQLRAAVRGLSPTERMTTGKIYVIDCLNDVRGSGAVRQPAETFMTIATANFPNAQVIVLPVILNDSNLNNTWNIARMASYVTEELKKVMVPYGARICEGSRSWFHNWGNENDHYGANDVHLYVAGYKHCQKLFSQWLDGGDGWINFGWLDVSTSQNKTNVKNVNSMYVSRWHDEVRVVGKFTVNALGDNQQLFQFPQWARAYRNIYLTGWNNVTAFPIWLDTFAQLVTPTNMHDGMVVEIDDGGSLW